MPRPARAEAIAARVSAGASHQSASQTAATDGSSRSDGSSSSSGSSSSDSGSTLQAPDWPPSASGGPGSVTSGGS